MTPRRGNGENRSYIPCFRRNSHSIFSLKKEYVWLPTIFFRERFKKGSQEESKQPFQHKTTSIIWWQNWEFIFHGWLPSHALSREESWATEHGRLTHTQSMRLPHVFHGASQLGSASLIYCPQRSVIYDTDFPRDKLIFLWRRICTLQLLKSRETFIIDIFYWKALWPAHSVSPVTVEPPLGTPALLAFQLISENWYWQSPDYLLPPTSQ